MMKKQKSKYYFYCKPLQIFLLVIGFFLIGSSWYKELIKSVALGYNEWLNFLPLLLILQIFLHKNTPQKWRISKVIDKNFTCYGLVLLAFFSCYNVIVLFLNSFCNDFIVAEIIINVITNIINLAVLSFTIYYLKNEIALFQKHQKFFKSFSILFIGTAICGMFYGIIENLAMVVWPLFLFATLFVFELFWFMQRLYHFIFLKEFDESEYAEYKITETQKEPVKFSIKFDKGVLVQVIMIAIILSCVYVLYKKHDEPRNIEQQQLGKEISLAM
ncbi:hypothetical protein AAEX28_11715 [Lentisphaerota bacterium WC36G]|nr:hypothetical protein LJT99_14550 [Lentisphaerae bacterium WC36]